MPAPSSFHGEMTRIIADITPNAQHLTYRVA